MSHATHPTHSTDFAPLEVQCKQLQYLDKAAAPGVDVHRAEASRIFKVPYDEVTDLQRKYAKELAYWKLYSRLPVLF